MFKELIFVVALSGFASLGSAYEPSSRFGFQDSVVNPGLSSCLDGSRPSLTPRSFYGSDQPYLQADSVNYYLGEAGYDGSNEISVILPFVRQVSTNYLMPDWDTALESVFDWDIIDDEDNSCWIDIPVEYNYCLTFQTTTNNFVAVYTTIVDADNGCVVIDRLNNHWDNLGTLQWSYVNGSSFSFLNSGSVVPCNPNSGTAVVGSIRWYPILSEITDDAYSEGYSEGQAYGEQIGYDSGYVAGSEDGYQAGLEAASGDYASGFEDGRNIGLNQGATLKDGLLSFFPYIFASVSSLIYTTGSMRILGISVLEVISLIVGIGVLALVLKVFLK